MSRSHSKETIEGARKALLAVKDTDLVLGQHKRLFLEASEAEQLALCELVVNLNNSNINKMGTLTAWEVIFALARMVGSENLQPKKERRT